MKFAGGEESEYSFICWRIRQLTAQFMRENLTMQRVQWPCAGNPLILFDVGRTMTVDETQTKVVTTTLGGHSEGKREMLLVFVAFEADLTVLFSRASDPR